MQNKGVGDRREKDHREGFVRQHHPTGEQQKERRPQEFLCEIAHMKPRTIHCECLGVWSVSEWYK